MCNLKLSTMTYNEFTERTNYFPTMTEFNEYINPMYIDTDENKDDFCKRFMKNHLGSSSRRIVNELQSLKAAYDKQVQYTSELNNQKFEQLKKLREYKDSQIKSLQATVDELQAKLYKIQSFVEHTINA